MLSSASQHTKNNSDKSTMRALLRQNSNSKVKQHSRKILQEVADSWTAMGNKSFGNISSSGSNSGVAGSKGVTHIFRSPLTWVQDRILRHIVQYVVLGGVAGPSGILSSELPVSELVEVRGFELGCRNWEVHAS